ncbi:hypothetical protein [Streptomyces torulosus]|nr:hypothetical protein [Streptomyces torulosus]
MPIIGFAGTFACMVIVLVIACVVVLAFGPPTARVSLEEAALTTH